MKKLVIPLFLALAAGWLPGQSADRSRVSRNPLSMEALAIYTAYLNEYRPDASGPLNLNELTVPFDSGGRDRDSCLREFPDVNATEVHRFPTSISSYAAVRVVNGEDYMHAQPAHPSGKRLVTLSEIVFDAEHQRAAFRYSLVCGGKCGTGGRSSIRSRTAVGSE